jgi:hypothetical protein
MPAFPFAPDGAPLEELIAWGYDELHELVDTLRAARREKTE